MGRIMVTGADGLIGSQFEGDIIQISRKVCDLRSAQLVDEVFEFYTNKEKQKDCFIDGVIHCAAKVGGLGSNLSYKGEFFYDNIMINTNIIESCRKYNIKNLVVFLSTCIFPDKVDYPLTEEKIHLGPPHHTNDAYAYAKRMADVQVKAYREQYGLNYKCVIPTNVYGPNDNFSLMHGHVIPMLIHKLYLAKRDRTDFVVWGSGKPLREFIYSKDVAKLTEWILNNYDRPEPVILSTSEEISIADVVSLLVEEFNYKGRVIFDHTKPDGQFKKPSSNAKLLSLVPDFKFTPIEVGIKSTVEWFINNYEKVRK